MEPNIGNGKGQLALSHATSRSGFRPVHSGPSLFMMTQLKEADSGQ
jgi:hypothetical protein